MSDIVEWVHPYILLYFQLSCKMDDEHFIEVVKKYPCLWNTILSTYKMTDVKDAAWEEILKETHISDGKCNLFC